VKAVSIAMETARPRVAVALATYNHAHYLADALDSVMRQTVPADEIIVVDDGSQDDPAAVVARYPGVRLVRQDNQGLSAARNTALRLATVDYILFLDADDALTPNAIEASVECFRRHPDAGFVCGSYRLVDAAFQPTYQAPPWQAGPDPHLDLLMGNHIGMHATVLYDRRKLLDVDGFDTSLRRCEDYDMYLRMARHYSVGTHAEVVALYRKHDTNMSKNLREQLRWTEHVREREREGAARLEARAPHLAQCLCRRDLESRFRLGRT
jgi:glycosyltransferase involved in cell wall biosynthesis